MISRNSRPYRAGKQMGDALCEIGNILYLIDNRQEYLSGLKERIEQELSEIEKRKDRKEREYAAKVGGS